jgi:PAS domain S-box-containing protein
MEHDDALPGAVFREDLECSVRRFPRRIADSLLSQSRLLLELMDCVDELVFILDPALRVIRANRYAAVFLGYAAGDFVTRPLSYFLEPSERERIAQLVKGARERRGGQAFFLTRSYERVRFSITTNSLADPGEEPHGYLLVGRRAGDESRPDDASNGLAERLLKGFADPLFIIDGPSRTVRDCNEAALAAFGFSREELVGRRLFDHATSEEERDRNEGVLNRAVEAYATAGIFQERVLFPRGSGPALPCDCISLPFFRPDGSLACIIVMLFDRSSDEEREAELAALIGRVNGLAAELAAAASSYSTRGEATRLSSLGFTRRQIEIARLVALGASSKDIGFRLGIAESTVKNHLAVMYRKLGTGSRMGFMRALSERSLKIS